MNFSCILLCFKGELEIGCKIAQVLWVNKKRVYINKAWMCSALYKNYSLYEIWLDETPVRWEPWPVSACWVQIHSSVESKDQLLTMALSICWNHSFLCTFQNQKQFVLDIHCSQLSDFKYDRPVHSSSFAFGHFGMTLAAVIAECCWSGFMYVIGLVSNDTTSYF